MSARNRVILTAILCITSLAVIWIIVPMDSEDEAIGRRTTTATTTDNSSIQVHPGDEARESVHETEESTSRLPTRYQRQSWVIRGFVRDENSTGIPGITVRIENTMRGSSGKSLTDQNGEFAFREVREGTYSFLVDEQSLPEGLLPPWGQAQKAHYSTNSEFPRGFYRTEITIPAEASVELVVFHPSFVQGYVEDSNGPIEGLGVHLKSNTPGLQGLAVSSLTDVNGFYEMDGVYPGDYRVQVEPDPSHSSASAAQPRQMDLQIAAGTVTTAPRIYLGGGSIIVSGRVLDGVGNPFPDLPVEIRYLNRPVTEGDDPRLWHWGLTAAIATTDADGRYEFYGLDRTPAGILVAHSTDTNKFGQHVKVKRQAELYLDLRSRKGKVEAPDCIVERTPMFEIDGQILLNHQWAEQHDIRPENLRVTVTAVNNTTFMPVTLKPDKEGRFSWESDAVYDGLRFEATNRGDQIQNRPHALVTPRLSAKEQVTISIPINTK